MDFIKKIEELIEEHGKLPIVFNYYIAYSPDAGDRMTSHGVESVSVEDVQFFGKECDYPPKKLYIYNEKGERIEYPSKITKAIMVKLK